MNIRLFGLTLALTTRLCAYLAGLVTKTPDVQHTIYQVTINFGFSVIVASTFSRKKP